MLRHLFCGTLPSFRRVATLASAAMLLLALSGGVQAAPRDEFLPKRDVKESKWKKAWKWSAAALMAGNALDVASSYGYGESNALLRSGNGRLNMRGTGIKFGVMAGALAGQYYLMKKHPELEKPIAITNFTLSAGFTGLAVRNWRVR